MPDLSVNNETEVFATGGNELVLATFLTKSRGTGRVGSGSCAQKFKANHGVLEG